MILSYEKDSSFSDKSQEILEDHIQVAIHDILIDCFENPSEELKKVLHNKEDYLEFYESNLQFWEKREEYKKCSKLKKLYEDYLVKYN